MKRILFILASLWLLFRLPLHAQSQEVEFYLYNSDKVRLLESYIQHQSQPLKDTYMRIQGQSSWDSRLNFHQEIRKSLVACVIGYQRERLSHNLSFDYQSYLDENDLDPTAYNNKNGKIGYGLYYYPIDSLSISAELNALIRNEQDRYSPGNILKSDGHEYLGSIGYTRQIHWLYTQFLANLQSRNLDWEEYHSLYSRLNLALDTENLGIDSGISFSQRKDEIYNLLHQSEKQQNHYQWLDSQSRQQLDIYSKVLYYPSYDLDILLTQNYSQNQSLMERNTKRNSAESSNNLGLNMAYRFGHSFSYKLKAQHVYNVKDFSYLSQIRHQELRSLSNSLAWEYNPFDSLSVNLGIELLRSSFPKYFHRWDNDLRSRSASLNWRHYYKERMRLNSRIMYQEIEDYYIDAMLSANNHQIRSLALLPEMEMLISDRLSFKQNYQIRADYSDYVFPKMNKDKLYRQLGYSYSLIYDNYPYIARSGDDRWFYLSYRQNPGSSFMSELSFSYEENQYADKEHDYYLLHTKNRRYLISLLAQQSIGAFSYSIRPQYLWGTWQEYSLISGVVWNLNEESHLEISISPVCEELEKIEMRSSVNLSLRF